MILSDSKNIFNLKEKMWKPFLVTELFSTIQRGKRLKSDEHIAGEMPYVSSSSFGNGVDDFVSNKKNVRIFCDCLSLANSGSVGTCFYEPFSFVASDHITHLKNERYNKYHYLFLAAVLNRLSQKYNFNREINDNRISKERILLPVDEQGQPDYAFMEEYIKECEKSLLQKYRRYIENKHFFNCEVQPLSTLEWKEFFIEDIFTISAGKRLTKSDMDNGLIPFVGAIDSNNGITNWIGTPNCSFDKNVLGVNYNGSVVENFYHSYGCVFSDDVKRLHLKNYSDNQYVLLFLKTIILQQKSKYTYGYKFNGHRMERQKILLPINEQGEPDFIFMENYVKKQENLLLQNYIKYIERRIEE